MNDSQFSDEDLRYPKYGLFGDPKDDSKRVCLWCGKQEVTGYMGWKYCSMKCRAASEFYDYQHVKKNSIITLALGVSLCSLVLIRDYLYPQYSLLGISLLNFLFYLVLLILSLVYILRLAQTGSRMREKSEGV